MPYLEGEKQWSKPSPLEQDPLNIAQDWEMRVDLSQIQGGEGGGQRERESEVGEWMWAALCSQVHHKAPVGIRGQTQWKAIKEIAIVTVTDCG